MQVRGSALLGLAIVTGMLAACGSMATSCTIGRRGTAAIVGITGAGAGRECDDLLSAHGDLYYATQPQDSKRIVCVVPVGGLTYTVRDEGLFLFQGNALCNSLTTTAQLPIETETP